MSDKSCYSCKWSSMDMDMEPFCVHPKTVQIRPFGSTLSRQDEARDHCGPDKLSHERVR